MIGNDKKRMRLRLKSTRSSSGNIIPISVRNGLSFVDQRPYTEREFKMYPHVLITFEAPWDPTVLDHEIDVDDDEFYDQLIDHSTPRPDTMHKECDHLTNGTHAPLASTSYAPTVHTT